MILFGRAAGFKSCPRYHPWPRPPDIPIGIYRYLLIRIIRQVRFRRMREWSYAGSANGVEAATRRAGNVIDKLQMHTTFEPVAFSG